MSMKHVILYGHLAKQFGRHHYFDVRTPAEAIRALCANFKTFRAHVMAHNEPGYHVRVGKDYRDQEGLAYPIDDVIKIVPAVGGASGEARILLGAAILFVAPYAAGWVFANTSMVGLATGIASMGPQIGMSLLLGGVASLLTTPPKAESVEPPESKPGYAFNGPVNTVTQGNPVPVCYGRMLIGSQVASASMSASDIPL